MTDLIDSSDKGHGDDKAPLTRDEALRLAVEEANRIAPGHEFVVLPERTTEHVFGWTVIVVPERYRQSGSVKDLVPGIAALVVERRRKDVVPLPSSVPTDRGIAEYQRRWLAGQDRKP